MTTTKIKRQTDEESTNSESKINGILVQVIPDEEGNEQLSIQPLGAVKITETPTLLKLAAKVAESRLGLS